MKMSQASKRRREEIGAEAGCSPPYLLLPTPASPFAAGWGHVSGSVQWAVSIRYKNLIVSMLVLKGQVLIKFEK